LLVLKLNVFFRHLLGACFLDLSTPLRDEVLKGKDVFLLDVTADEVSVVG
jgi:hypothetical protein